MPPHDPQEAFRVGYSIGENVKKVYDEMESMTLGGLLFVAIMAFALLAVFGCDKPQKKAAPAPIKINFEINKNKCPSCPNGGCNR